MKPAFDVSGLVCGVRMCVSIVGPSGYLWAGNALSTVEAAFGERQPTGLPGEGKRLAGRGGVLAEALHVYLVLLLFLHECGL